MEGRTFFFMLMSEELAVIEMLVNHYSTEDPAMQRLATSKATDASIRVAHASARKEFADIRPKLERLHEALARLATTIALGKPHSEAFSAVVAAWDAAYPNGSGAK